jgi:ABC-type glycerol-3-phosphate transport system permease component
VYVLTLKLAHHLPRNMNRIAQKVSLAVVVICVITCLTSIGAAVWSFVGSSNGISALLSTVVETLVSLRRTLPAQVLVNLNISSEPYQFAGGFFMMIPALIFIFFIRRYLFNMWGQITK